MRIYVASSWRNVLQPTVVAALRGAGHIVYDFRDHGFDWKQCATAEQLFDPRRFRDEVLSHPLARAGFAKDMDALKNADATVLVLPCGRSAHLELGYAVGAGQRTVVLLDDPISEPELMHLMCTKLCTSMDEVLDAVQEPIVALPVATLTYGQLVDALVEEHEPLAKAALRYELLRRLERGAL